jgi:hypothetical protein
MVLKGSCICAYVHTIELPGSASAGAHAAGQPARGE